MFCKYQWAGCPHSLFLKRQRCIIRVCNKTKRKKRLLAKGVLMYVFAACSNMGFYFLQAYFASLILNLMVDIIFWKMRRRLILSYVYSESLRY